MELLSSSHWSTRLLVVIHALVGDLFYIGWLVLAILSSLRILNDMMWIMDAEFQFQF